MSEGQYQVSSSPLTSIDLVPGTASISVLAELGGLARPGCGAVPQLHL